MKKYLIVDKTRMLLLWSVTLTSLMVLLIFPKDIRNGGTNGAFLCIQVLIPSLFPFMVLSDFIVRSGLSQRCPKLFSRLTEIFFRLPKETFPVVLLSLIGGYPVGARGTKALLEKGLISEKEAKRMALFLVGAGPGFLLTFMGGVMLRDLKAGYILLLSQTLCIIITGFVSAFGKKTDFMRKEDTHQKKDRIRADCLVESVKTTIGAMSLLCGLVVLFSALCEVYLSLAASNPILRPLCAFFEITTGAKILSEGYPLPLISFFTAFGGLCVHLQILSQLSPIKISFVRFFLSRLISGILSFGITTLILRINPREQSVFSSIENPTTDTTSGVFGSVMLILMSILFLLSLRNFKITTHR